MEENNLENENSEETVSEDTGKRNMTPIAIVIAVLLVAAVGAYMVWGGSSDSASTTGTTQVSPVEELPSDESQADMDTEDDIRIIEVEGGSYYFDPDIIEVRRGETVRIVLNSVDMMHDFVIDELGVNTGVVSSGDSAVVEFVATELGEYEFYCSVMDHRAQGMVGTLIVTE